VSLNPQQQAVITAVSVDNGSYDNCQYVVLSVTPSVFSCASLGTNQVTLQVSDGTYSSTCTAVVTVQDNLPPSVLCRNTTVQLDNTGQAVLAPPPSTTTPTTAAVSRITA
jgi:hypothetical protein